MDKNQNKQLQSSDDQFDSTTSKQNQILQNKIKLQNPNKQTYQLSIDVDPNLINKYVQYFNLNAGEEFNNDKQNEQLANLQLQKSFKTIEDLKKQMIQLQSEIITQLQQNQFIISSISNLDTSLHNNQKINFKFKVLRHIPSYEVIELYCQLGRFSKKFIVHNSFKENLIHDNCPLLNNQGSLSNVYNLDFNQQKYIIKCVHFRGNVSTQFSLILKEIFIASMMSALEIGPRIKRINGFDFCVYSDCVQFAMQVCNPFKYTSQNQQELKLSLLKMHSIKMVHNDIKPQNIRYSPFYGKVVFIDFGLTQLLSHSVGKRTLTRYIGTKDHSSDQMINLLKLSIYGEKQGFVDLYGNDIHGLKLSLTFFRRQVQNQQIKKTNQKSVTLVDKNFIKNENRISIYDKLLQQIYDLFIKLKSENKQNNFPYFYYHDISQLTQQLILTSVKSQIFYNEIIWKKCYHGHDQSFLNLFDKVLQKDGTLEFLADQLDKFRQSLMLKIYQGNTENNNVKNTKQNYQKSSKIQNQINLKKLTLFFTEEYKINQKIKLNNISKNNLQLKMNKNIQQNFHNIVTTYYKPQQTLELLLNELKIKQNFFERNLFSEYLQIVISNLDFTQFKGITIQDKLKIIKVFNQLSQNSQVQRKLQNQNKFLKYSFNIQQVQEFQKYQKLVTYNTILFKTQQNCKQIFHFYKKLIVVLLAYCDLRQGQRNDEFIQSTLMPYFFKIIKSSIILGFEYYLWIKKALYGSIRFILEKQYLQEHFLLVIFKEFIELGIIVSNFYSPNQQKKEQNESFIDEKLFLDYLNDDLFMYQSYTFIDQIDFKNQQRKQVIIKKVEEVLPHLWIFFNQELASFTFPLNQFIKIFNLFQSELIKEFRSFSDCQKFQFVGLYQKQLEILKDIAITRYILGMQCWRGYSSFIVSHLTYEDFWFNKQLQVKQQTQLNCFNYDLLGKILKCKNFQDQVSSKLMLKYFFKKIKQIIGFNELNMYLFLDIRVQIIFHDQNYQAFKDLVNFFCDKHNNIKFPMDKLNFLHQFFKKISVQKNKQKQQLLYLHSILQTHKEIIQFLKIINERLKIQQKQIMKLYLRKKFMWLIRKFIQIFENYIKLSKEGYAENLLQQMTQIIKELNHPIKQFEDFHSEYLQMILHNKFYFFKLKANIKLLFETFYLRKQQFTDVIEIAQIFLMISNRLPQNCQIYSKKFKNEFSLNYSYQFIDMIPQQILFQFIPLIIPSDFMNDFISFESLCNYTQTINLSSILISTIYLMNMLNKVLKSNINQVKQYINNYRKFIQINFSHISQLKIKQVKDYNYLEQYLMNANFKFLLFFYEICSQYGNDFIEMGVQMTIQLLRSNYLVNLQSPFELCTIYREYFRQNIGLKKKFMFEMSKILFNKENRNLFTSQSYVQYYYNILNIKLVERQKLQIQKNKKSISPLIRKMMKNMVRKFEYQQQEILSLIREFLQNGIIFSSHKKKISKVLKQRLDKKHKQKRLKILQLQVYNHKQILQANQIKDIDERMKNLFLILPQVENYQTSSQENEPDQNQNIDQDDQVNNQSSNNLSKVKKNKISLKEKRRKIKEQNQIKILQQRLVQLSKWLVNKYLKQDFNDSCEKKRKQKQQNQRDLESYIISNYQL